MKMGRQGVSFVEIMVAATILGAAFIPILGIVNGWTNSSRAEKMEAQVTAFVAKKMNEYLIERPWAQVTSQGWTAVNATTDADMDGIQVEWKVQVTPIITLTDTFDYPAFGAQVSPGKFYHPKCAGAESVIDGSAAGVRPEPAPKQIDQLDLDAFGGGTEFLREIELQVRWRWPGTDPGWTDRRKIATFLTRRANLR